VGEKGTIRTEEWISDEELSEKIKQDAKKTEIPGVIFILFSLVFLVLGILLSFKNPAVGVVLLVFCALSFFVGIFLSLNKKPNREAVLSEMISAKPEARNQISANVILEMNPKKKYFIFINSSSMVWQYLKGEYLSKSYPFSDLLNYEIIENENVIFSKCSSSIGSAIIGGVSFKGTSKNGGALGVNGKGFLKSVNKFFFRLFVNDVQKAGVVFEVENAEKAYQIISTFELIEKMQAK